MLLFELHIVFTPTNPLEGRKPLNCHFDNVLPVTDLVIEILDAEPPYRRNLHILTIVLIYCPKLLPPNSSLLVKEALLLIEILQDLTVTSKFFRSLQGSAFFYPVYTVS